MTMKPAQAIDGCPPEGIGGFGMLSHCPWASAAALMSVVGSGGGVVAVGTGCVGCSPRSGDASVTMDTAETTAAVATAAAVVTTAARIRRRRTPRDMISL